MQEVRNTKFINFLDLVMIPVADFTARLFDIVGYLGQDRIASRWKDLPLVIGGELKHLKPDVCFSQNETLLVAR